MLQKCQRHITNRCELWASAGENLILLKLSYGQLIVHRVN
jgi:hypothetical protein